VRRHDRSLADRCLPFVVGRFAQFGQQAARGLDAWRSLDGAADVLVEDDRSDRRELEELLPGVAAHCDLLLGPYSTQLMRTAGKMAASRAGWPGTTADPATTWKGRTLATSSRC